MKYIYTCVNINTYRICLCFQIQYVPIEKSRPENLPQKIPSSGQKYPNFDHKRQWVNGEILSRGNFNRHFKVGKNYIIKFKLKIYAFLTRICASNKMIVLI